MITGKETNFVYLSALLYSDEQYRKCHDNLIALFIKHDIGYGYLEGTKDIWCRDYMPIQVAEDHYVQFRYEPSYLRDCPELRSEPHDVCKVNHFDPVFSDINLDGGNVVSWSDKAIVTDRIFDENPEYSNRSKLIADLEELLEVEVIVIPQIKSDMTGHADGMLRFFNGNTVIGNDRSKEYNYWRKGIEKVIKEKGLHYLDIPFFEYKSKHFPDNAIGCYINYLEIADLIILPVFETTINYDREVYDLFTQIFPDRKIETINFNEVGLTGGLLNCCSWGVTSGFMKLMALSL